MIEKPVDAITKADIDSLVQNAVREGRTIEYKETLPGNSDEEKRELLADVSSFANASGGDLLYGIKAVDGVPHEAPGCSLNPDADVLRLENIIRDCVQPRIPGMRMVAIDGFLNGPILLVRVPRSWSGPHVVLFKNSSRFFTRSSAGKYPMDVTEIRAAFLASESLPQKIRQFRDERLGRIVAGETPVRLTSGGRMVLHLLPLASFAGRIQLDMSHIEGEAFRLRPIGCRGWNNGFNLDGFVNFSGPSETGESGAYCLLFRSGQVEAVDADAVSEHAGKRYIAGQAYEEDVIGAVVEYTGVLKKLDVECPLLFMLSMTGVRGAQLGIEAWRVHKPKAGIDRDILLLPEILIEDYNAAASREEAARVLRPAFDAVWNACGFARSFNYDDKGNRNPQR